MQNVRRITAKLGGSRIEKLVASAAETALKDTSKIARALHRVIQIQCCFVQNISSSFNIGIYFLYARFRF
jgi:hypothetical protein